MTSGAGSSRTSRAEHRDRAGCGQGLAVGDGHRALLVVGGTRWPERDRCADASQGRPRRVAGPDRRHPRRLGSSRWPASPCTPERTRCSTGSTPSSARSPPPCAGRCACSPAPAPARPARSPTASPTACAPGVYQPQQVLAVTFTARAAGEMRGRLRELGAGGVQARTFHSAALRQLQLLLAAGGRRRAAPEVMERKASAVAEAGAAAAGSALDRAGCGTSPREIEWAKVTLLAPETTPRPRAAPARAHPPVSTPRRWRGSSPPTRRSSPSAASSTSRTSCCSPSASSRTRTTSPSRSARQYRHFVVDEYQDVSPLQQRLLDLWLGERRRPVRRRRRQPDHLLLHRRHPRPPARLPHPPPAARSRRAGPRLPLHAAGRRPRQRAARAGPAAAPPSTACELVAQRPPGPARRYTEYADEPAEAEGVAAPDPRAASPTGVPAARSPCCSAPTPSPRPTSRRSPTPASPTCCGAPSGSSTAPRCARRSCCCAAPPAPATPRCPLADAGRATCWPRRGLDRRAARAAAARSASAGSRWPRWSRLAEDFARPSPGRPSPTSCAELDERAAAQHAPTVEGVTLASLHAAKGLEWDAVFLVGLPRA